MRSGATGTCSPTHRRQLFSMCCGTPLRPGGWVSSPSRTSASRLRRVRSRSTDDSVGRCRLSFDASSPRGPSEPARPDARHGCPLTVPHVTPHGHDPERTPPSSGPPGRSRSEHPRAVCGRHSEPRHDTERSRDTRVRGGTTMTTAPSTRPPSTSAESDALRALYADWADIIATTPGLTMRLFRSIFDEWHQPTREPEDVTYREETVGGRPGHLDPAGRRGHLPGAALHARRWLRRRLRVQPPQAGRRTSPRRSASSPSSSTTAGRPSTRTPPRSRTVSPRSRP